MDGREDGEKRCFLGRKCPQIYVRYRDEEWGREVHDDHKLFEMLSGISSSGCLSYLPFWKSGDIVSASLMPLMSRMQADNEEKQRAYAEPCRIPALFATVSKSGPQ